MCAKGSKECADAPKSCADILEAEDQIPIHRELKCFINCAPAAVPNSTSPEHRFLRHKVGPSCHLVIVGRKNPTADFLIVLVNNNAVTIDDIHVRIARKKGPDVLKRARQDEVVRI